MCSSDLIAHREDNRHEEDSTRNKKSEVSTRRGRTSEESMFLVETESHVLCLGVGLTCAINDTNEIIDDIVLQTCTFILRRATRSWRAATFTSFFLNQKLRK